MERNKIKICCNPYEKTIEYYRWDKEYEQYLELTDKSKLSKTEFTKNITIQNKIQDILEILQDDYNVGNAGMDIEFEGTSDDYHDMIDALKIFCAGKDIRIYKGKNELLNASETMKVINAEYSKLEKYFDEKNADSELKDIISKYKNAVKPNIPICVMGLYSAGKSSFINSLIGQEILPSASDPTTARNYRITAGNHAKICFTYNGQEIVLNFDGSQYKPNKSGELEILKDLQSIITDVEKHTLEIHMNKALEILNKEKYNGNISDIIKVTVPFVNSSLPIKEYTFEIYDTPGSDSASHKEHLNVLKESIKEQTNGLPILVTDCDSLDKEGNRELIDTIKELGDAFDQTNTMIIINKADDKANDVLEEKKDSDGIISKWQSNRLFFVSSIIGLGSKKANATKKQNWIDSQYHKIYKNNYMNFVNPNKRDDFDPDEDEYKELYKYNIWSEDRKKEYQNSPKGDNEILVNSGIQCVEYEIGVFARKYALYNKCEKAKEYLDEAIKWTTAKMEEIQKKQDEEIKSLKESIGAKERELIKQIEKFKKEFASETNKEFAEKIDELKKNSMDKDNNALKTDIDDIWKRAKEGAKGQDEKIKKAESDIQRKYNEKMENVYGKARMLAVEYFADRERDYRNTCIGIVSENQEISKEKKQILTEFIMKVKYIYYPKLGLRPAKEIKILMFKTLNKKEWVKRYDEGLNNGLEKMSDLFQEKNKKSFEDFIKLLSDGLIKRLAEFNPDLKEKSNKVDYLNKKQNTLNSNCKKINESKEKILNLTEYKECVNNE